MAVRSFRLTNANGTSYDLTAVKTSGFLHSVTGLGYETLTEFQRLGDKYSIISDGFEQGVIKGAVYFGNEKPQDRYQEFINFLQYKPLTMEYEPYKQPGNVFYRRGVVTEVVYEEGNTLTAEVTFKATTLPYKRVNKFSKPEVIGDSVKRYDYRYNYTYKELNDNEIVINSNSAIECGVKLTMFGYLSSPEWQHYVNGELVATGRVNTIIEEGHALVIDTTVIPFAILDLNLADNSTVSIYNKSDFATKRFIELQEGENVITITDLSDAKVQIYAEANIYYASV